jgi:hypothetical protein
VRRLASSQREQKQKPESEGDASAFISRRRAIALAAVREFPTLDCEISAHGTLQYWRHAAQDFISCLPL